MKKISLLNLFFIFIKIGAILLGGGYVILPILENEFVEKRKLIEHDDLINFFALKRMMYIDISPKQKDIINTKYTNFSNKSIESYEYGKQNKYGKCILLRQEIYRSL